LLTPFKKKNQHACWTQFFSPLFGLNSTHFLNLVRVLEKAHGLQLVHRDVKLANFFQRDMNGEVRTLKTELYSQSNCHSFQILLNDWTFALPFETKTLFEGSLQLAPDEILEMMALDDFTEYIVHPRHDLEMVVKTVFQSNNCCTFSEIRNVGDPETILAFWKYHLQPIVWQEMLQAARNCNYKGLITLIKKLLPSH